MPRRRAALRAPFEALPPALEGPARPALPLSPTLSRGCPRGHGDRDLALVASGVCTWPRATGRAHGLFLLASPRRLWPAPHMALAAVNAGASLDVALSGLLAMLTREGPDAVSGPRVNEPRGRDRSAGGRCPAGGGSGPLLGAFRDPGGPPRVEEPARRGPRSGARRHVPADAGRPVRGARRRRALATAPALPDVSGSAGAGCTPLLALLFRAAPQEPPRP